MNVNLLELNYLAVVVCAVVYMALGFAWYSTVLFGNLWMNALGKKPSDLASPGNPLIYVFSMAAAFVLAFTLAILVRAAGITTLGGAVSLGLITGIGIAGAGMYPSYVFENRKTALFLINAGNITVSAVVMSVILTFWS